MENKTKTNISQFSQSNIPVWEKAYLTLNEAAEYFNIGTNTLRDFTNQHNECALFVGHKRLIKRKRLEKMLDDMYVL